MKYIIKVEQRHIDEGLMASVTACPIALAVREQLKDKVNDFKKVAVGCGTMNIYSIVKTKRIIDLPWKAVKFIHNFDKGNIVHPFEFEIEV